MERVAIYECLVCHCWNELRIGDLPDWVPEAERETAFVCAEQNKIPLVCQGKDCMGLPVIFRRWEERPEGERRDTKQLTNENQRRNE
jgi:hypothetical protein